MEKKNSSYIEWITTVDNTNHNISRKKKKMIMIMIRTKIKRVDTYTTFGEVHR
jgi:hypothetical protein